MKTIKVGVVGCGNAALFIDLNEKKSKVNLVSHLSILKKNKNFKLIACCDVDLSKFKKLKKIFKDINVYNSFQKMINLEKDIDLLIISTPTSYHYSQCKIALKHKNLKMVVCEKPFGFNYHNALEIVKEFKKTKKYLLISYQRRFDPFFIKIKRLIKNKILGRLVSITAQVDKAFFQNSSHMIDLIINLAGKIKISHGYRDVDFTPRKVHNYKDYGGHIMIIHKSRVVSFVKASAEDMTKKFFELELNFANGKIFIPNDNYYYDIYKFKKHELFKKYKQLKFQKRYFNNFKYQRLENMYVFIYNIFHKKIRWNYNMCYDTIEALKVINQIKNKS